MIRALRLWLCIWTLAFHAAAALAPALAGPVPAPILPHTCPAPMVHHRIACPSAAAAETGAPWLCRKTTITDSCSEEYP